MLKNIIKLQRVFKLDNQIETWCYFCKNATKKAVDEVPNCHGNFTNISYSNLFGDKNFQSI